MYLKDVTSEMVELVRQWRNVDISMYRTPFYLTEEMQQDFYKNVICNRNSKHRYYAMMLSESEFVGMIGLVNISLENRNAEISIVIDPELRGKDYGNKGIELLLDTGFNQVNLDNIYGECYKCNQAVNFWEKIIKKYNCQTAILPERKYFNGEYYDSIYFNFKKEVTKC